MEAKEYLGQIRKLDTLIKNKLRLMEDLRDSTQQVTAKPKDVAVKSTARLDRLEEAICKIVDLEKAIANDIEKLAKIKNEIIATIDQLDNADMIEILYRKYVHLEDWTKIVDEMCLSEQSIYRLHGIALAKVNAILKNESK